MEARAGRRIPSVAVAVAAVALKSKSLVVLSDAPAGLRQGSAPGRELSAAPGGILAPQAGRLWFLARGADPITLKLGAIPAALKTIPLESRGRRYLRRLPRLKRRRGAGASFVRNRASVSRSSMPEKAWALLPPATSPWQLALDGDAPLRALGADGGAPAAEPRYFRPESRSHKRRRIRITPPRSPPAPRRMLRSRPP